MDTCKSPSRAVVTHLHSALSPSSHTITLRRTPHRGDAKRVVLTEFVRLGSLDAETEAARAYNREIVGLQDDYARCATCQAKRQIELNQSLQRAI
jgi:hypothetical protein